jgi:hypothetical protein
LSHEAFQIASALVLGLRLEKRGRRWALLPEKEIIGLKYGLIIRKSPIHTTDIEVR